ncbi:hypothetical protein QFZ60_000329 [Arthrobacter sp. B2I5]|uniref:hypothetical protein n=1 Tax=Arthrobacter sp. B2I5 TaxID=3042266 RepID=UPI00278259AE|nr:hypothetical protein [Arthrobacter sp. B2I5]MDQ0824156.1 hypothetical protein [Arthrobacter sp. B2I5]
METGVAVDARGSAGLAAAVMSIRGLADELAEVLGRSAHDSDGAHRDDHDPLGDLADSCLDGLGVVARIEAVAAAAKVRLLATYAESTAAMEAPAESAYESSAREMSLVAEVACVLTIGERAAAALSGRGARADHNVAGGIGCLAGWNDFVAARLRRR